MKNRIFSRCFAVMLALLLCCLSGLTIGAEVYTEQSGKYKLIFDDAGVTDAAVTERILTIFREQYEKMAEKYNPNAPRTVMCTIDPGYDGVAYASGNKITVSAAWLQNNPNDADCVTHELFHVVQGYPTYDPVWLVEGLADYARGEFGLYNDLSHWGFPSFDAGQHYTNSYTVTARFLAWCVKYVNPDLVVRLDSLFRQNRYTPSVWEEMTGATIDNLWAEYAADPGLDRMVGDVDLDGNVTVSDVVALRTAIVDGKSSRLYDIDFDRHTTVSDVVALRAAIVAGEAA